MTTSRVGQYYQSTLQIDSRINVLHQGGLVVRGGVESHNNAIEIHQADFG